MSQITAVILTLNEELNIRDCIHSVKQLTDKIILIDSGSNDKTISIAQELGVSVVFHKFISHSKQFNWALNNIDIDTEWVIRVDADERITDELAKEIKVRLIEDKNTNISGYVVKFKTMFMGKPLRWGGVYPFRKLILFKFQYGEYEDKNMDEHIILEKGISKELKEDALHYDYKDIDSLVRKHNWYATKEANDYIESYDLVKSISNKKILKKRKGKQIYYKFPLFFRCFVLFVINYFLKLGFLDGMRGLVYHSITVFFYRFIVDSKIYEYKQTGYKVTTEELK